MTSPTSQLIDTGGAAAAQALAIRAPEQDLVAAASQVTATSTPVEVDQVLVVLTKLAALAENALASEALDEADLQAFQRHANISDRFITSITSAASKIIELTSQEAALRQKEGDQTAQIEHNSIMRQLKLERGKLKLGLERVRKKNAQLETIAQAMERGIIPPPKRFRLQDIHPEFEGRANHFQQITDAFTTARPLVVLVGPPGIGKSEIAVAFADQKIQDYKYVWTVDGSTEESIKVSLRGLLKAMFPAMSDQHISSFSIEAICDVLESAEGGKWLLIYDGLEQKCHFPKRGGDVLITTRSRELFSDYSHIEVGAFTEEESINLIKKITGEEDSPQIKSLAHAMHFYPLPLVQSARHIKVQREGTVLSYLGGEYSAEEDYSKKFDSFPMHPEERYPRTLDQALGQYLSSIDAVAIRWLEDCSRSAETSFTEDIFKQWMEKTFSTMDPTAAMPKIIDTLVRAGWLTFDLATKTMQLGRIFQTVLSKREREFLTAIKENNTQSIQDFLATGANFHFVLRDGATPMHIAAGCKSPEAIDLLIEARFPIDSVDDEGNTPAHIAAKQGQIPALRKLISAKTDLNAKNKLGNTPLHLAVRDTTKTIQVLIAAKPNLEVQNNDSLTPLHLAAKQGKVDALDELIKARAEIEAKNASGDTPARSAIKNKQTAALVLLLTYKCDLGFSGGELTLLHEATLLGNVDAVRELICGGADINALSGDELTSLHYASQRGLIGVAQCLVDGGISIDAKGAHERTPLHLAAAKGQEGVLKLLKGAEADIEAKDAHGFTPLHLAAANGQQGAIKILVNGRGVKADKEAVDKDGFTPLHWAARSGQAESIKTLQEVGSEIEGQSTAGYTPIHVAAAHGQTASLQALLDAGANVNAKDKKGRSPFHLIAKSTPSEALNVLAREVRADASDMPHPAVTDAIIEIVNVLKEKGGDVNGQDNKGSSPLHKAAKHNRIAMITRLMELDAVVTAQNHLGYTPYHVAAAKGHGLALHELVTKALTDLNVQTLNGSTPLHLGAEFNHVDVVNRLVGNAGTEEKEAVDKSGATPLHRAARHGSCQAIDALVAASVNLNAQDEDGFTPLHQAIEYDQKKAVTTLLSKEGNEITLASQDGLTPLHRAFRKGNSDVLSALVKAGADPKAKTCGGWTVWQLAKRQEGQGLLEALRLPAS